MDELSIFKWARKLTKISENCYPQKCAETKIKQCKFLAQNNCKPD